MNEIADANRAYYAALSARDMEAMAEIWDQSENAVNIAPPTRPMAHVGWPAIRRNYEEFWSTLKQLAVTMVAPSIVERGDTAWVYGVETTQRTTPDGTTQAGKNYGTSIFVRSNGRWLMVFHQAAPIL
jgi:ketosteroid isomerase-like protein